jgi:hypothetical protein
MASTYSSSLKLELMETGANANTWGNNTNTNLQTVDAFTAGFLSKDVGGSANVTLTTNNADPTAEASNKVLDLNGTLTANIHVFIPAVENNYIVYNNTSGSFSVTIAATGHAANGIAVTQGEYAYLYCDGSANYNVKNSLSRLSGDVTIGGTITEESSIALKENIRPLENLNGIYSINAVKYDKIDGSQKDETGFIAEEVYKYVPELVQLKDGKPEAVKYTKMTAYLLEAIKELKTEIDMLKRSK